MMLRGCPLTFRKERTPDDAARLSAGMTDWGLSGALYHTPANSSALVIGATSNLTSTL
jgi:hypothetical protein